MMIRILDQNDLNNVFPILQQLRPTLIEKEFVEQYPKKKLYGYRLVGVRDETDWRGVAGFRICENYAWNRFLYVDELVTRDGDRSKGFGKALLDWLRRHALENRCLELHLDSGVQRFKAHRFYLREGMDITSHHFRVILTSTNE